MAVGGDEIGRGVAVSVEVKVEVGIGSGMSPEAGVRRGVGDGWIEFGRVVVSEVGEGNTGTELKLFNLWSDGLWDSGRPGG